ncbi:MAG: hypothetical protein HY378_01555 [Candidatus Brennerbacteria bacterium]|nr:hypothetical protein [Candidatus Brennerbacteria bacterium]
MGTEGFPKPPVPPEEPEEGEEKPPEGEKPAEDEETLDPDWFSFKDMPSPGGPDVPSEIDWGGLDRTRESAEAPETPSEPLNAGELEYLQRRGLTPEEIEQIKKADPAEVRRRMPAPKKSPEETQPTEKEPEGTKKSVPPEIEIPTFVKGERPQKPPEKTEAKEAPTPPKEPRLRINLARGLKKAQKRAGKRAKDKREADEAVKKAYEAARKRAEKEAKDKEEKEAKEAKKQAKKQSKKGKGIGTKIADTGKKYAKALGAGIKGAKEGWSEKSAERKEIEKELKEMRAEERGKVGVGLNNIGFFAEEWKDNFFAKTFGGAAKLTGEKGRTTKFWEVLGKNFERDAEKARKKIAETGEKKISGSSQLANVGYLMRNILKYGRTVTDVVGYTLTSPLRYVMMGGMAFARGAEAAKEARLLSEGVIEKTRLEDAERAADIAWGIYEKAQAIAGERPITAKELQEIYRAGVPKDIIERLDESPEAAGVVSKFIQGIARRDIGWSVVRIEEKIEDIEADKKLSEEEKKIKKQRVFDKHSRHLDALDRMVSQQGTVDMLALGAKYTETAAKAVVAGMMVETLALSMRQLWEWKLAGIFSDMERAVGTPEVPEAPPTEPVSPVPRVEQPDITRTTVSTPEPPPQVEMPPVEAGPPVTGAPAETGFVSPLAPTEQVPVPPPAAPEEPFVGTPAPEAPTPAAEAPAAEAVTPAAPAEEAAEPSIFEQAAGRGPEEYIETIGKGGSIWRATESQLEKQFDTAFTELNEGQRTYLIDSIKDEIVADPTKFIKLPEGYEGAIDVDNLPEGTKVDLSSIIQDRPGMVEHFSEAGFLPPERIATIERNNETLQEWVREHPGERLTSERVEAILTGGEIPEAPEPIEAPEFRGPALEEVPTAEAEVPTVETPAEEIPKAAEARAEAAKELGEAVPGTRKGEYFIAESGPLYNARIRFSYDKSTGLPVHHNLRPGWRFFGNPEDKLKDDWFETMSKKLNITARRGLTPQDDYLLGRVKELEVIERISEKLPKNSPEARYLGRVMAETTKKITERFGDVFKS